MIFLGKIYLEAGGKRLGVKADGNLTMLNLAPDDPAGMFLAYDVGGGWFSLQAYTGAWVNLIALQSEIAWYPVLYRAYLGGLSQFAMFVLQLFEPANRRVLLRFKREDNGELVDLGVSNGINPYCRCELDVGRTYFGMGVVAPGVPELQQTKDGVGYNFGCLGSACVDLGGVAFSGVNFQDADFTSAKLRGASFERCTLTRTKFRRADLSSTDFRQSSVAWADFSDTDLTTGTLLPEPPLADEPSKRTVFRNAKVPAASLKKDWSYLDLTNAEITGLDTADLRELRARYTLMAGLVLSARVMDNADFSHSDLTRARFQDAQLRSAKFQSATLTDCIFSGSKLALADFDPDPADPLKPSTDLTGAKFSFADLPQASMQQAILLRAVFTAANMKEINLTAAQLGGVDQNVAASLSYVYMDNAKLDNANLFGVNFSYATVFGASTSVTQTITMEQSNFTNAYLAGIDLTGANLRGAQFTGACLVNVRLNNAILLPTASGSIAASLAGATLQGAQFAGAQLNHANLSNAAVSFANGEIPVRYCDEERRPFPEPPASMPLRYGPTAGLDLTTMGKETKCPNGFTVAENELSGKTLRQMLTSANAPMEWFAAKCGPAADEVEQN